MMLFFFFKQKTAYEMRISDWSSDVCSSDLCRPPAKTPPPLLCDAAVGVGVVVLQRQGTERHVAGDAGAAADPGIELDAATVQLDEALHQREAEAGAAVPRLQRAALELAEHAVAVGVGNANAGIGDLQQHLAVAAPGGDRHRPALHGEFQRDVPQVEERQAQATQSDELRDGKERAGTGRSWWSASRKQKKKHNHPDN